MVSRHLNAEMVLQSAESLWSLVVVGPITAPPWPLLTNGIYLPILVLCGEEPGP